MSPWTGESTSRSVIDDRMAKDDRRASAAAAAPEPSSHHYDQSATHSSSRRRRSHRDSRSPSADRRPSSRSHASRYHEEDDYRRSHRAEYHRRDDYEHVERRHAAYDDDSYRDPHGRDWRRDEKYYNGEGARRVADSRYYDEERRTVQHRSGRLAAGWDDYDTDRERRDDRRQVGEYNRGRDSYADEKRETSSRYVEDRRNSLEGRKRDEIDRNGDEWSSAKKSSDRHRSRERDRERDRHRREREGDREAPDRLERRHDRRRDDEKSIILSKDQVARERERERHRDRNFKGRNENMVGESYRGEDRKAKDDRRLLVSESESHAADARRTSHSNGRRPSRRGSSPADDDAFERLQRKVSRPTAKENANVLRDKPSGEVDDTDSKDSEMRRKPYESESRDSLHLRHHQRSPRETDRPTRPPQRRSLVDKVMASPRQDSSRDTLGSSATPSEQSSQLVPPPLSFGPVKLPHELLEPGNEMLLPSRPDGKRLMPYRVTYDPKLDKKGSGKELVRSTAHSGETQDPRKKAVSRRPVRKDVRRLTWAWDEHSTEAKPPPPPRAICVTGLSPLITLTQLKQHFRLHGRMDRTELKLDDKTGESLGVCYVQFAQDFDEDLKLKDTAVDNQRGDLIAKSVIDTPGVHRVGDSVFQVMLDDDERTNFLKESLAAMEQKHMSKLRRPSGIAEERGVNGRMDGGAKAEAGSHTVTNGATMPPPSTAQMEIPKGPRALNAHFSNHRNGYSSHHPQGSHHRPGVANTGHASPHTTSGLEARGAFPPSRINEAYSPRAPPLFTKSRPSSAQAYRGHYEGSGDTRRERGSIQEQSEPLQETTFILDELAKLGHPYLFVQRVPNAGIHAQRIGTYFQTYRPVHVYADKLGWYLAFGDAFAAEKSLLLDKIDGVHLSLSVRRCPNESLTKSGRKKHAIKTSWTEESLLQDAKLLVYRELGSIFMRELRTRTIKPFIDKFLRFDSAGGQALHPQTKVDLPATEEDESGDDQPPRRGVPRRKSVAVAFEESVSKEEMQGANSPAVVLADEEAVESVTHKKQKKTKKPSKVTSSNGLSVTAEAIPGVKEEEEEEEDAQPIKAAAVKVKTKSKKAKDRPKSPALDPFVSGLAEDEEDLYYLKMALKKLQSGHSVADLEMEAASVVEALNDGFIDTGVHGLPRHSTGSARTEGYYRIPPSEKALHLPDRNRAVVDPSTAVGLASARDNRADSRRFVQGIEQHKKETATDTDILKFNQLRSRKKQLKFAKSPIHDWGLYAMELIPAGDMVIEYVGEIVRQQVADQREKNYERQGNFSTYLFRVDDDVVVDATKKGNIARLMNHCCTPNCNAKILTLNGEKRIVLFAKNTILPGQELTYDYKFQATGDEEDAIACLCGSPGCRRFL